MHRCAIAFRAGLLLAVLLSAGCTSVRETALTVERVGPLSPGRVNLFRSDEGFLEVYSERERIESSKTSYDHYTPYTIYNPQGKRVQGVVNHVGSTDQHPMTVRLPVGDYVVYARAEGYGIVKVPILIGGSRLTAVYLERSGLPDIAAVPDEEKARLPDGRAVGRRAAAPAPKAR